MVTSFTAMPSPLLPKTCSNPFTYSGSVRTISRMGSWSARPPSTGLTGGCRASSSRLGERPSQNWVFMYAALTTVGALRVPVSLLTPSEVFRGVSVKAFVGSWQVAHETSPVLLKRLSL